VNVSYGCQDVTFLLTDYLEDAIPWNDKFLLRLHLNHCKGCQQLLADFKALPRLVKESPQAAPGELTPIAEQALAGALRKLGHLECPPPTPVPEPVRALLASGGDLPLRILAQTHQALFSNGLPREAPYLPPQVLSQLPAPNQWKWHRAGRVRRALLAVDPKGGQRLSMMRVPPKHQIPEHFHHGTESVLVLEGEMEDAGRCLGNGDWIHFEMGSSHAPYVFEEGCWCLVRDEGTVKYQSPLGWLRASVPH